MRPTLPGMFLVIALIGAGSVSADGRQWLDKMSRAIQDLNYEGTFVYSHGNEIETMRIIHGFDEDGEKERLVSLNGSAREVIRDDQKVTCILPDTQAVMVHESRPRKPFPVNFHQDLDRLGKIYQFQIVGDDRVANRAARVIVIQPNDHFRYGYRIWIDKDSHLLLKSELTDIGGEPVEQVMFTDLKVYDRIDSQKFRSSLSGSGYKHHEVDLQMPKPQFSGGDDWEVAQVPEGFMMTHHNKHHLPSGPDRVEHMVYSDGLATVSIYVERPDAEKEELSGGSRMGAVNAYGRRVSGHQVTVVGEVPELTVKAIALSVRSKVQ